jgi:hypothetical protein
LKPETYIPVGRLETESEGRTFKEADENQNIPFRKVAED